MDKYVNHIGNNTVRIVPKIAKYIRQLALVAVTQIVVAAVAS